MFDLNFTDICMMSTTKIHSVWLHSFQTNVHNAKKGEIWITKGGLSIIGIDMPVHTLALNELIISSTLSSSLDLA